VKALALTRARASKRAVEVTNSAHVTELEWLNADLMAEFEYALLTIVEAESHWKSLYLGYTKLEEECASLHTTAETLK
jgi:predicted MarR family transcription regulator